MTAALVRLVEAYDEAKHKRGEKGSPAGGQFVAKDSGEHSGGRIDTLNSTQPGAGIPALAVDVPVKLGKRRIAGGAGSSGGGGSGGGGGGAAPKPVQAGTAAPLGPGDSGAPVLALQKLMGMLGRQVGPPEQGTYGSLTAGVVKELQQRLGMKPTGKATVQFQRKLADAVRLSGQAVESVRVTALTLMREAFHPDQLRAPKGSGVGGRWVKGLIRGGTGPEAEKPQVDSRHATHILKVGGRGSIATKLTPRRPRADDRVVDTDRVGTKPRIGHVLSTDGDEVRVRWDDTGHVESRDVATIEVAGIAEDDPQRTFVASTSPAVEKMRVGQARQLSPEQKLADATADGRVAPGDAATIRRAQTQGRPLAEQVKIEDAHRDFARAILEEDTPAPKKAARKAAPSSSGVPTPSPAKKVAPKKVTTAVDMDSAAAPLGGREAFADNDQNYFDEAQRELAAGKSPSAVADTLLERERAIAKAGPYDSAGRLPADREELARRVNTLALRIRLADPETQKRHADDRAAWQRFEGIQKTAGVGMWWGTVRGEGAATDAQRLWLAGEDNGSIAADLRGRADRLERLGKQGGLSTDHEMTGVLQHDQHTRDQAGITDAAALRRLADAIDKAGPLPSSPPPPVKKAAGGGVPAKKLTAREISSLTPDEAAAAARDGRATPRAAAKRIRERAQGLANSIALIGLGKPDHELGAEGVARRRVGLAEVARLRALADELEARPPRKASPSPAVAKTTRPSPMSDMAAKGEKSYPALDVKFVQDNSLVAAVLAPRAESALTGHRPWDPTRMNTNYILDVDKALQSQRPSEVAAWLRSEAAKANDYDYEEGPDPSALSDFADRLSQPDVVAAWEALRERHRDRLAATSARLAAPLSSPRKASGAVAKMTRGKAPKVDVPAIATELRVGGSEGEYVRYLAGRPDLTASKLQALAAELGIDIPPTVKAKTSLQMHIAEQASKRFGPGNGTLKPPPWVDPFPADEIAERLSRLDPSAVAGSLSEVTTLANLRKVATALNIQLPRDQRFTNASLRAYIAEQMIRDRTRWSLR